MLNEKDTFKIRNYTTDQTATMFSCKDCIWIDEKMESIEVSIPVTMAMYDFQRLLGFCLPLADGSMFKRDGSLVMFSSDDLLPSPKMSDLSKY